jgi:hypothetical protein
MEKFHEKPVPNKNATGQVRKIRNSNPYFAQRLYNWHSATIDVNLY